MKRLTIKKSSSSVDDEETFFLRPPYTSFILLGFNYTVKNAWVETTGKQLTHTVSPCPVYFTRDVDDGLYKKLASSGSNS